MAPRMLELLIMTAELAGDDIDSIEHNWRRHIPGRLGGNNKIIDELQEVFSSGIAPTLRGSRHPTTANVKQTLRSWSNASRNNGFFQNGGTFEDAIDICLRLAESVREYNFELFDESVEENDLPETPIDEDYDLVCIMCLDSRCFE
mmetsp:Transcript_24176/g.29674  ORF Transcript_24176/g.29674 Transcript_24176/m.29674 type:complete len:146 (+) Transcript_24176:128-565(+)